MNLAHWIIDRKPNQIALLLVMPLVFGFMLLLIIGSNEPPELLALLAITLIFQLCIYGLYTQLMAIQLIKINTDEPVISRSRLIILGISSPLLFILACIGFLQQSTLVFLFIIASIVELVRLHSITKLIISSEKTQSKSFWVYVATLWILVNPIVGIWSFHKRVYNILK